MTKYLLPVYLFLLTVFASFQGLAQVRSTVQVSPSATISVGQSTELRVLPLTRAAMQFDGVADQITVTEPSTGGPSFLSAITNNFTVEAWFNPTVAHEIDQQQTDGVDGVYNQHYLIFPTNGDDNFGSGHAGMGISVGINGVSVYEHAGAYMPPLLVWKGDISGWTHLAVVYIDRTPALYINGKFKVKGLQSPKAYVHPSLVFGGDFFGYFQGQADEIRIWQGARSANDIYQQYNKEVFCSDPTLIGCWHLNEGEGTVANDATPGQRPGKLMRGKQWTRAGWSPNAFVEAPPGPGPQWIASTTPLLTPDLTYTWSPSTGLDRTTGSTVVATPLATTTYVVTAATSCTTAQASTTVTVTGALPPDVPDENRNRNWTMERSFDGNGNEVAASKQFTDGLGRPTQAQSRNAATQQVFAAQNIYSSGGQPVLQTMAAPINNQSFNYKEGFIQAGAQDYGPAHFEEGQAGNPTPVDALTIGTLGYYYSQLNTAEPLTPITSYPYSLVEPYEGPLGGTRRAASPGDELRMGKGREAKGRDFPLHKEFDSYLTLRPQFVPGSAVTSLEEQGIKSISIDADGRESIIVTNKDGQAIISALSGPQYPALPIDGDIKVNPDDPAALAYLDVHIPSAGAQDVKLTSPLYSSGGRVLVVSMLTNDTVSYVTKQVAAGGAPEKHLTLTPGFYRLIAVTGTHHIYYEAHYGNFSYTYYDDAGRVVATVAPKGLDVTPTGLGTSSTQPVFITRNTYDTGGQLLATESNDEGRSEYIYAHDGRIRFSQSALQRLTGLFSYSNYDEIGRVVESGEYTPGDVVFENHLTATPTASSVLQTSLLEDRTRTGGLAVNNCTQRNQVWYDLPWDGSPGSLGTDGQLGNRRQEFVVGAVSKTQNENVTTWYSYDELGRVTWVVQNIGGVGVKTLDYTYDFSGNVLTVAYQKGQADSFYHYYSYDAAQRLTKVYTSPNGIIQTLQAEYSYYLHGPLKRVQVAGDLQGVDYAYTLQGALKAINHVDQTLEPGHDSPENNGVYKDLFALNLDYFSGDYRSRELDAPLPTTGAASVPTRYDGTIQSTTWRTGASADLHRVAYVYDEKSQLQDSRYGQWQRQKNNSYVFNLASANALQEGNLRYDANGNMLSLRRTDQQGNVKDDFAYTYKANTNQLQAVHPAGSPASPTVLNYDYDELGQMTRQKDEQGQRYFTYDVTGKTIGVYLNEDHTQPLVEYAYDDRGFRVRQTVYPSTGGPAHITTYVRDVAGNLLALYEQATPASPAQRSEVPLYGASRLGNLTHLADGTATGTDDYRYELNDHLGNARVVFHRPGTTVEVETMELSGVPPRAAFLNDNLYRVAAENAPTTGGVSSNDYVAKLVNSQPEGKELKRVLNVTKGDTITFSALAQWNQDAKGGDTGMKPVFLVGAVAGLGALSQRGADGRINAYQTNKPNWLSQLAAGLGFTLGGGSKPVSLGATSLEGWIKYRVLNTNGTPMVNPQGEDLVGVDYLLGTGGWEYLQTGVRVPENGIIEVMAGTSGSGEAVYFDNLRVEQTGGLIVQEQHQYAFGAPLPGLSYTVGNRRYRYGYQGQYAEHDDETGYESFELRLYNSRIGRWLSYDPEGQYDSPYVGIGNNPVSGIDPTGGWSPSSALVGGIWGAAGGAVIGGAIGYANEGWSGVAGGAALGAVGGGIIGGAIGNYVGNLEPNSLYEARPGVGKLRSSLGHVDPVPEKGKMLLSVHLLSQFIEEAGSTPLTIRWFQTYTTNHYLNGDVPHKRTIDTYDKTVTNLTDDMFWPKRTELTKWYLDSESQKYLDEGSDELAALRSYRSEHQDTPGTTYNKKSIKYRFETTLVAVSENNISQPERALLNFSWGYKIVKGRVKLYNIRYHRLSSRQAKLLY